MSARVGTMWFSFSELNQIQVATSSNLTGKKTDWKECSYSNELVWYGRHNFELNP